MRLRKPLVSVGIVGTLALIAAACSGGTTKEGASHTKGTTAAAAAPAPGAPETPAPAGEGPITGPTVASSEGPTASAATAGTGQNPAGSAAAGEPGSRGAKRTSAAAGAVTPAAASAGGPTGKAASGARPGAATPGAPTPGKANKANYASDVGVTADSIRLGTINMTSATRSLGPAIAGVQEQNLDAVVKYVNRIGGVSGRQLQLVTCHDGGDVARARACYEKLKGSVFAMMPSITWVTDVIHDRLVADKIPWLSWGWFKSEYEDPWMFPCHANGKREAIALATWTAKVIKPKTVGIMYLNVSEDIAARDDATRTLEQYGVKVVASVAQEWDSPDESQHVLAMRAADPDFILSFSWPTPVAKFMHDASTQHYAPKLGYAANHLTGDPGYGPIFGDYIKDKTYTITSWGVPTAPDPANPEGETAEKLLVQELIRTNGREYQGFKWRYAGMHHITQSAWVCTRILAQAAAQMGPDLTREGLKKILESPAGWESGLGVRMYWPSEGHDRLPYSYNREFIYKWVSGSDGGWDLKRILPDPVFDCKAGNIPPMSRSNVCGGT